jgi:hypothetical protein
MTLDDETIEDLRHELAMSQIMDAAWPDGHRAMAHAILEKFGILPREAIAEVLDFLNSIEGAGYGGMASFEIAREHIRSAISL